MRITFERKKNKDGEIEKYSNKKTNSSKKKKTTTTIKKIRIKFDKIEN
jgi:hypothetical protein